MSLIKGMAAWLQHWSTDETGTLLATGGTNPLPVSQMGAATLPTGAATAAKQPALGTAGTPSADVISIQGFGYSPNLAFTRVADTNAYAAGDVIGINAAGSPGSAIHTLLTAGPSAGEILIEAASLRIDLAAVPANMTSFRLHLFDAAPDAVLDNAAFDLASAGDRGKYLGFIDLGAPLDLGSTLLAQVDNVNKRVKLAAASTSLYGVLQTNGGYTPTSAESFKLQLRTRAV